MRARFFYDIVCPYAYMASLRVDELFDEVSWEPILLGGVFQSLGSPQVPAETWPEVRQQRIDEDIVREGRRHGLELRKPAEHPRRSVYAMRLILAAPPDRRREVSRRLFEAYWLQGQPIERIEVVQAIGRELGLEQDLRAAELKEELKRRSDEAAALGVFGVPTVICERGLFWGADRLGLARGERASWGPPAGSVRFFHDFASPFSYLASTQIERVAARVEWTPILLGALFKAIGTPMVPLHTFSPAKQRYLGKDMRDWAAHWGVPIQFPSVFPVRTVLALRVSILEPRAIHPLYRAVWVEDRDVSVPDTVRGLLREEGLDPGLVEATQDPGVKQVLVDNTALAQRLGVCGVPTFHVGGQLLWGQDRLGTLRELLGA